MTKSAPRLDLCTQHRREAFKLFRVRGRAREAPPPGPGQPRQRHKKRDYGEIGKAILKATRGTEKFNGAQVAKTLKLPYHATQEAIRQLLKAGTLKAHGKSAGRYLTRAGQKEAT